MDQAYLGHSAGSVYVGLFRASTKKPQILKFGVSARHQSAICKAPGRLTIESLEFEPDAGGGVAGLRKSSVCKGLELNDDTCDQIHLYWNHASQQLDWWRN